MMTTPTSDTLASDLIPPIGAIPQAERMFRVNWVAQLTRSPSGVPLLAAEIVARQGHNVRLIDIREPDELTGVLGHIHGADWIPRDHVDTLTDRLGRDEPIVLISRGGERAAEAARRLEQRGLRFVAALQGGMIAWKTMGFAATRDPDILERRDVLQPYEAQHRPEGPLSADDIATHIGDARSVRWIKMAALLLHGQQSCVDGRDDSGVIGTPGGDAGEFLLALAAVERVTGRPIDNEALPALLARRMDTFGRLYMHSDTQATNKNIKSMRSDHRLDEALANVYETLEWRRFMEQPPVDVREIILEHLVQPDHMGCGHLRRMLQAPERYDARADLIREFIRAFFRLRWDGAFDAEFVTLAGAHGEGAVVNVVTADEIWPFSQIPLISPSCAGTQMFVNHPQVSASMRLQLAQFLCLQGDLLPLRRADVPALKADMDALADKRLGETLRQLAKGLPIYEVAFDSEERFTIKPVGVVD